MKKAREKLKTKEITKPKANTTAPKTKTGDGSMSANIKYMVFINLNPPVFYLQIYYIINAITKSIQFVKYNYFCNKQQLLTL